MKKKKKLREIKMLVFTKNFTIFLQQILNSKLLQAVIDGKKIILMIGSIVNVALLKKNKNKNSHHFSQ